MGAIACEASNYSTKFGPPTAARQPSYPQIFPRSQRCVASPTPSARNVTGSTFSSTMLASARAALPVNERPATATASCLHPATYMATTMVRQSGVTPVSTVEEGAEAILNLAVADELAGRSGEFYNGLRPSKANPQAYDDAARERLRVLSLQLTGLA